MKPLVSVTIVTMNQGRYIVGCLESLRNQDYKNLEILVLDNASTDNTKEFLSSLPQDIQVYSNSKNTGFCSAQNQLISRSKGAWILCLNPDTRLQPNFISELMTAADVDKRIGIVCPKIFRMHEDGSIPDSPILDSTGVYMTRWLRHHDRGSQQVDNGSFDSAAYVFGYTGAAVLFRRSMIEDISIEGEFMDEDFVFYREDADVAWRAQLLGWRCLYMPRAVGYHVRRVFEGNRRVLSPIINMHSVKNRFLMRIKNITPGVYRRVFIRATLRDFGIIAYCFFREQSSLPGLWFVLRNWRRTWAKRRWVQERRLAPESDIVRWFNDDCTVFPADLDISHRGTDRSSPLAMSNASYN